MYVHRFMWIVVSKVGLDKLRRSADFSIGMKGLICLTSIIYSSLRRKCGQRSVAKDIVFCFPHLILIDGPRKSSLILRKSRLHILRGAVWSSTESVATIAVGIGLANRGGSGLGPSSAHHSRETLIKQWKFESWVVSRICCPEQLQFAKKLAVGC